MLRIHLAHGKQFNKWLSLFLFSKKYNKSSEPYKWEFTVVLSFSFEESGQSPFLMFSLAVLGALCLWNLGHNLLTSSQFSWQKWLGIQTGSHREQWINRTGYTFSILAEVLLGTHTVLFLSPLKWKEAVFTSQDLFKDTEELQVSGAGGCEMQSPEKVSVIISAFSVNAFNQLLLLI